jgi:hypothetical protein
MIDISKPWQVLTLPAEDFLIGMSDIGTPQQMSMVGSFAADPDDPTVRTAHRDKDLPWHRDGIRSQAIADMQGGNYIEAPNVDLVGMYCLRDNTQITKTDGLTTGKGVSVEHLPCYTVLAEAPPDADPYDDSQFKIVAEVDLYPGQALLWDNRLWHRRHGAVGTRLLVRFWTTLDKEFRFA